MNSTLRSPGGRASAILAVAALGAALFAYRSGADEPAAKAEREKTPSQPAPQAPEANAPEAAIRATAAAFVQAFNRGDAKAIAELWTAQGSLLDDRGETFKGRAAIQAEYEKFFRATPGARIEVIVKSVDFPTPTLAVEEGVSQVIFAHAASPLAGQYVATHVLEEGQWRMAAVRETAIPLASNFSQLQDLDWLVGDWETIHDGAKVHSAFRWIAHHSFLQRDYAVRHEGIVVKSGTQIIGWDPQAGRIRSWSFDSTGGYGTGLWTAAPWGWQIDSIGLLPDGSPTSSLDMLIRVAGEKDVFGWQSTQRKVGDIELPDTPEVILDRVAAK